MIVKLEQADGDNVSAIRMVARVCVIGNSCTGAVLAAYRDSTIEDTRYDFNFFANPGKAFGSTRFEGNRLAPTAYFTDGSRDMTEYDFFVVYGDLPTPRHCLSYERSLSKTSYSSQLRAVSMRDWASQFNASKIATALRKITSNPIFILSHIYAKNKVLGFETEEVEGIELLTEAVAPNIYIPSPRELLRFSPYGRPDPKYYENSLNIDGREPNRVRHPSHDNSHLNKEGGKLVLNQIIQRLREMSDLSGSRAEGG